MEALERLDVWKRSTRLCVDVYRLVARCRDRAFKDQLSRSALSVPSNIAEGYERGRGKEFVRFLKIAKGSCGELRTQLYIGIELQFLDRHEAGQLVDETRHISRMLHGLMKHLDHQTAARS